MRNPDGMPRTVYPGRHYGVVVIYSPAREGDMRLCVMQLTGQMLLDAWAAPECIATKKEKVMEKMAGAYDEVIRTGEFPEDLIHTFLAHLWHMGPPVEEVHTIIVRVGPVHGIPADLLIGSVATPYTLQKIMKKDDWTNVAAGWAERAVRKAHGMGL